MGKIAFAFLSGVVFAIGLLVAQMTNPAKVTGFLDITGQWDPSLAFVMGGALAVFGVAWALSRKPEARPLLDSVFYVPEARGIDKRLVAGSRCSRWAGGWAVSARARRW
jgi:uncharacterized membrane protein YedE/YeeE